MKKRIYLLCAVLLIVASSVSAQEDDWRKISNKFYSLSVPANWTPMQGMKGNGHTPGERDIRGWHLYYFFWSKPIETDEDLRNAIGVSVDGYQKSDHTSASVDEVEEMEMKRLISVIPVEQTVVWPKNGQRRFYVIVENEDMYGNLVKYRKYYLFQKEEQIVHCVHVSIRDSLAQQPAIQQIVKKIFDSFAVVKQ